MGTSYDLYCLDCKSEADVSAAWDPIHDYSLTPALLVARSFRAMQPIVFDSGWQLLYEGVRIDINWLVEHGAHRLRIRSEYGEIQGTCAKSILCSHCSSDVGYCTLDIDHEGACKKE
jgi:hypothetical protein